jgi:hypothetical protein
MATLNEGLTRVGARLQFDAKLSLNGLPTLEDVEGAVKKLLTGPTSLEDVMAPFHNF